MEIESTPQFLKQLTKIKDNGAKMNIRDKLNVVNDIGIYRMLSTQDAKQIKPNLYEIRTRYKSINYRLLCTILDNICWLLHLVVKKTQKLELHDINTALSRKKDLEKNLKYI